MREQFNRNVTTLLTHSDLSSDLTVVGGLYQQRLGATNLGLQIFASEYGCIDLDLNNAMLTYTLKDTPSYVDHVHGVYGRNFQNHCPKLANSIAISWSQGTSTYPR